MIDQTTKLDLGNKSISSIEGLQLFTKLGDGSEPTKSVGPQDSFYPGDTTIDLSNNKLTDINALSTMTNLRQLNVNNNKISDISPLANIKTLEYADLGHNQIHDITPLKDHTNLRQLFLDRNQITDYDEQANPSAPVNGLDPLASLSGLEELSLSGNKLHGQLIHQDGSPIATSTLAPLAKCEHLVLLDLSSNQIQNLGGYDPYNPGNGYLDINPFFHLRNLSNLNLSDNPIRDITQLQPLHNLGYLNLNGAQLQDETGGWNHSAGLSNLAGLSSLAILGIAFNHISDLSPLTRIAGNNRLVELNISGTQVSDLTPLKDFTNLSNLYIGRGSDETLQTVRQQLGYDQFDPFQRHICKSVYIDGVTHTEYDDQGRPVNTWTWGSDNAQISDITPLSHLNLRFLCLNDTSASDLSALKNMTNLSTLDISSNHQNGNNVNGHFTDLSPLAKLDNLDRLDLEGNKVTSIAPLARLRQLRYINASYNLLTELPSLTNMSQLTTLYANNNHIRSVEPIEDGRIANLSLSNNELTDLTPLKAAGTETLYLDNNHISDLSPLGGHSVGRWILSLSNNQIKTLSGLGPINATYMSLDNNAISDLGNLKGSTFYDLDLLHNKVSDLTGLEGTQINQLELQDNQIKDTTPLTHVQGLSSLSLGGNAISDISPIARLTNLNHINLDNQTVSLPDAGTTSSITMESAKGLDGNHLEPTSLTPENGSYDSTLGTVKWNSIDGVTNVGLTFQTQVAIGKANATFSGTISQKITGVANTTPTPASHTITFDPKGGSAVSNETVSDGGTAMEPNKPTRDGYRFGHWQIKKDGIFTDYDFKTPVKADITLYATWIRVHTVTFVTGDDDTIPAQTVDEGSPVTAPTVPNRTGYQFVGWQIKQDGTLTDYDLNTPVTADITLNAKWEKLPGCIIGKTSITSCFPDKTLADAVAYAQADHPGVNTTFTQAMIDNTTQLSHSDDGTGRYAIKDLTGLQRLTKLTSLDLSNNQISDLSPLSGLTNLRSLNLSHNRISDISPLAGLGGGKTAVRALADQTTTLPRTRSLASSPSALIGSQGDEPATLRDLNLAGNSITDTSALSGLTSLTDLNISGNQIDNVAPLSDLQNLTDLNIADNKVADISPLSGLKKLTSLNLDNNQVGDVKPLADLVGLTDLSLDGNHISDTAPLTGLSGLTTFNLKDQNSSITVESLSPATIELPEMNRVDSAEATCAPSGCSASVIAPQSLSGYSVKVSYPEGTKEGTLNFSETGALGRASGIVSGVITLKLSAPESGSGSSSAPAQPGTTHPGQQPQQPSQQPTQKPTQGPAPAQKHTGRIPSPQAHGRTGQRISSTGAAIAAVAVLALLLLAAGLTIVIVRRLSSSSQKNEANQQSNGQLS